MSKLTMEPEAAGRAAIFVLKSLDAPKKRDEVNV